MTTAVQGTQMRLTEARSPALWQNGTSQKAGGATLVSAQGADSLAWAKAKSSMDDTAMTNSERWEKAGPEVPDDDVRMDKVERLRAAIANGTYSVSAEALAEKMIEHMRENDVPTVRLRPSSKV